MKRKIYPILLIAGIATMIGIAIWPYAAMIIALIGNPRFVAAFLRDSGSWGRFILIILLILQAFLAFIPGQGLMLASGYIYGFWQGLLLTWFGLTLGGQISFWLARRYGRPLVNRFISEKVVTRWDSIAARQGVGFYIISLFVPIFPNDAMCFVAGLGEISFQRFLVANMVGRLIATASMTFVGAYGAQIPMAVWVIFLIAFGLFLLAWKLQKNSFLCPNTNAEV